MSNPMLSVRNLNTTFVTPKGPLQAVNDVSFDVYPGEVLGIVGESGSGKSVTLRSILGLLRPPTRLQGEVRWRDENLLKASRKRMRKVAGAEISIIFQEPMTALNPVLTVGEQIFESLYEHERMSKKQAKERAEELFSLVGISSPRERLGDYAHQFSGGMRQRAMIAIALASNPQLLLADEPTTALDVTIQDQILKLLLRLKDQLGMSVVIVTHDLGVVAQTCDRVAVMYAGRIVETAPVAQLLQTPRHAYTLGLLRSLPGKGTRRQPLLPILGAPPNLLQLPSGCAFAPRCPYVSGACEEQVPPLVEVAPEQHSACVHHDLLPQGEVAA
ncbi:MAG: ABC transporter ATP-binding protein [Deinococcota bacterium]|nr:ABC transporter ATP-binding protein [Deinococcota bacterium]